MTNTLVNLGEVLCGVEFNSKLPLSFAELTYLKLCTDSKGKHE